MLLGSSSSKRNIYYQPATEPPAAEDDDEDKKGKGGLSVRLVGARKQLTNQQESVCGVGGQMGGAGGPTPPANSEHERRSPDSAFI